METPVQTADRVLRVLSAIPAPSAAFVWRDDAFHVPDGFRPFKLTEGRWIASLTLLTDLIEAVAPAIMITSDTIEINEARVRAVMVAHIDQAPVPSIRQHNIALLFQEQDREQTLVRVWFLLALLLMQKGMYTSAITPSDLFPKP